MKLIVREESMETYSTLVLMKTIADVKHNVPIARRDWSFGFVKTPPPKRAIPNRPNMVK